MNLEDKNKPKEQRIKRRIRYAEQLSLYVGNAIRYLRKKLKISQKDLADGIMDQAYISKIEHGKIMPGTLYLMTIFEKLGVYPNNLPDLALSDKTQRIQETLSLLNLHLEKSHTKQASELIAQLESNPAFIKEPLSDRLLNLAKAENANNLGECPQTVLGHISKSLEAFKPIETDRPGQVDDLAASRVVPILEKSVDLYKLDTYVLIGLDIEIYNRIAKLYYKLGHRDIAETIWRGLIKNIEDNYIDETEKGKHYPAIIHNLTTALEERGSYDEVLMLCDKGNQVCLKTMNMQYQPDIHFARARSLMMTGKTEECERILRSCFIVFEAFKRFKDCVAVRDYALKHLGIYIK